MKLLISFCNQHNRETQKNLVVLDTETKDTLKIEGYPNNNGVTGLTQDNENIYAIYQADTSGIVIIDKKTLKIKRSQKLPELKDPHSLIIKNSVLYIVSTGTDSINKYTVNHPTQTISFERIIWKPGDSKGDSDTHHLNSIYLYDGRIYVSGFGPKNGERWSSAENGYIIDVLSNEKIFEGIYHPHSIIVYKNKIFFTESSKRAVRKGKRTIIKLEEGYTRGLCIKGNTIIVGTSSGRKRSKSTGLVNNFADPGMVEPSCKVMLFEKKWLQYKKKTEFDFYPEYQEIYDILIM